MAASFGCAISSFPQTYLGLPLSTHKLRIADFNPIMTKADLRLSGWRGRSLPIGGHLFLVNSILTSMLAHALATGILPAGVIEAIDKRKRAFFGLERKLAMVVNASSLGRLSAPLSDTGDGSPLHSLPELRSPIQIPQQTPL
jgi:hypothetical protein